MSRGGQHSLVKDGSCISKTQAIQLVKDNVTVENKPFLTKENAKAIVENEKDFPKTIQDKGLITTGITVIKTSNPEKKQQHLYDAQEVHQWIAEKNKGEKNVK